MTKIRNKHYKAMNRYMWDIDWMCSEKKTKKHVLKNYRKQISRYERRQNKQHINKER